MASAEKKIATQVVTHNYVLTLSEQEAELLAKILGDCVSWGRSPGVEEIFDALSAAGAGARLGDYVAEYDKVNEMFRVEAKGK